MTKLTQHQKVMLVGGLMDKFGFSDWETHMVKNLLFGDSPYDTSNSLVLFYLEPLLEKLEEHSEDEVKRFLGTCVDFCKLLYEGWGDLASKQLVVSQD